MIILIIDLLQNCEGYGDILTVSIKFMFYTTVTKIYPPPPKKGFKITCIINPNRTPPAC